MLIRNAELKDLPFILDIMNEAILHTTSIYDYEPRAIEFVENWFVKKKVENMPIQVCEINKQAVGYASYGIFRPWDAYQYSLEHSVYVHSDFCGQGIGTQLLKTLIHSAKTEGFHTMIAGIDASNLASCHFHRKLGFSEAGRLKEVGFKFEKWLDLIFMQLHLKDNE